MRLVVRDGGMALISALVPGCAWQSGAAAIDLRLHGRLAEPGVEGAARVSRGLLKTPFLRSPVQGMAASVRVRGPAGCVCGAVHQERGQGSGRDSCVHWQAGERERREREKRGMIGCQGPRALLSCAPPFAPASLRTRLCAHLPARLPVRLPNRRPVWLQLQSAPFGRQRLCKHCCSHTLYQPGRTRTHILSLSLACTTNS